MAAILTRTEAQLLLQHADRVTGEQACALGRAQCEQDGWFWLGFVTTRDEADPVTPLKRFPCGLPYLRPLWEVLATTRYLVLAKSRQMLVSWTVMAYCVWWARYHPNQLILWQTKGWDDAVSMIALPEGGFQGRAQFMESHLPDWLRVPFKASEGRIQYANGSMLQALAGGADKVRGLVPSVFVSDEFAHQDDQPGVYAAVAPLMQKGAKVIFISTPNGSDNTFCTLYHGRPMTAGVSG